MKNLLLVGMINGRTTCGTFSRALFPEAKELLWNQRDWRKDGLTCCSRRRCASFSPRASCLLWQFFCLTGWTPWLNQIYCEPHGSCLALNQRFHESCENQHVCLNYDSRSHYSCDYEKLGGGFKLFVLFCCSFHCFVRTPALLTPSSCWMKSMIE